MSRANLRVRYFWKLISFKSSSSWAHFELSVVQLNWWSTCWSWTHFDLSWVQLKLWSNRSSSTKQNWRKYNTPTWIDRLWGLFRGRFIIGSVLSFSFCEFLCTISFSFDTYSTSKRDTFSGFRERREARESLGVWKSCRESHKRRRTEFWRL